MERSRRWSSSGLWTAGSTTRRPFRACQRRSNRWRPSIESTIYEPPVALVNRAADAQFQPHERESGSRRRARVVVPTEVHRGGEPARSGCGRRVRQARRRTDGRAERLRRHHRPHLARGAVLPHLLEARRAPGGDGHQQPLHVERRRQVLRCDARDPARRRQPQDGRAAEQGVHPGNQPRGEPPQPGVPARLGRSAAAHRAPLHSQGRARRRLEGRRPLRHRLHEPRTGLRHQLADPRVLRLGGAAHGRPRDPARRAPGGGEASVSLASAVQGAGPAPVEMTSLVQRAVDHYHELLSDELAGESQAALEAELRSRGLFFGERPLCTVLRPRFLAPEHYRFLRSRCAVLLRAFDRAYRAALTSDVVRRQFGLAEWEEALVPEDPGFSDPSPTSRIDAFYFPEQGDLRVTEYNAETPAGTAYNDALSEVFLALPVMRRVLRRFDRRPVPARHGVLNALYEAYGQWGGGRGSRAAPRIGILDWREVPTYSEFVLFAEYFRAHGLDVVIGDPREAELRNGAFLLGGAPVDLIYKRVLLAELVARGGCDHAVIRAVRSGAVCMVNPFRCKILHKKASLAVLSDERNAKLFSVVERRAIDAHVPWTRTVAEQKTLHGGRKVDLVPFILAQRDRLVLKPNDEYGGKGIVLGWEVDDAAWERAVGAALAEPTVVQEGGSIPNEPVPSPGGGRVTYADPILDTNPFACHGAYVEGCLSRLSTAALVNVTAGGGSQVPTFLVEAR